MFELHELSWLALAKPVRRCATFNYKNNNLKAIVYIFARRREDNQSEESKKTCSKQQKRARDDCNISTRAVTLTMLLDTFESIEMRTASQTGYFAQKRLVYLCLCNLMLLRVFLSLQFNFEHTSDSFKHIFSGFCKTITPHVCQLDVVRNAFSMEPIDNNSVSTHRWGLNGDHCLVSNSTCIFWIFRPCVQA